MGDISENLAMEKTWYKTNLEKILEKKEKGIKVDDVEIKPGCPAGENFAALILRVVVYGRRLHLGVWTDVRKNFIVKRIPEPSSPCHEILNCSQMFQNEIIAYEDILPLFQSYLDKKSQNEAKELCFPKYFGQCHYFLVLQDLQTEGYQVVNRVKGFSLKECSIILQELSRFHALSFALKKEEKRTFFKKMEKLKESVFCSEFISDVTGVLWENAVKFAIRSLTKSSNPRIQTACQTLKFYSGQILKTIINLIGLEFSKFEVICHGDLWCNNVLLRYCDSGYPVGVKFIDLQAMRYSSCVLDVMHILFTSSRPAIYEKCFHLLLFEYYNSLTANLKNLGAVTDFTFDEFMGEFKKKIFFGVFVACLMFTCTTKSSPPDTEMALDKNELVRVSEFEKMYKNLSLSYHERLHALFLALTEFNLIGS